MTSSDDPDPVDLVVGLLGRLMAGDFGLPITFGLFVLIGYLWVNWVEGADPRVLARIPNPVVYVLASLVWLYFPVAGIAIWRAANQFDGPMVWPILAKVSVGAAMLWYFGLIAMYAWGEFRSWSWWRARSGAVLIRTSAPIIRSALVRLRLAACTDEEKRKNLCNSLLHEAARGSSPGQVNALVAAGADVHATQGPGDDTPLMSAAALGTPATIHALLAAGAKIEGRNSLGNSALEEAAMFGSPGNIQVLVDAGADLSGGGSEHGRTALHCAVGKGALAAAEKGQIKARIQTLIASGADVNARAGGSTTPLHWAAASDSSESIQALIAAGADLEAKDDDGETALHEAAHSDYVHNIEALVAAGASLEAQNVKGETPLHKAVEGSYTIAMDALIEAGASVHARAGNGNSVLHCAYSSPACTAALVAMGADINAREQNDWKPVHMAAWGGYTRTLWVLREAGADMEARTSLGETLLHIACGQERHDTVRELIDWGADTQAEDNYGRSPPLWTVEGRRVDIPDERGFTSLHTAAFFRRVSALEELIEGGADATVYASIYKWSWTPLHIAAFFADATTLGVLIRSGANVSEDDEAWHRYHMSPLHCAARAGKAANIGVLLAAGADVEARDSRQRTPLHCAAFAADPASTRALIAAGAAADACDGNKRNPLHFAAAVGNRANFDALRNAGADPMAQDKFGKRAIDVMEQSARRDLNQG